MLHVQNPYQQQLHAVALFTGSINDGKVACFTVAAAVLSMQPACKMLTISKATPGFWRVQKGAPITVSYGIDFVQFP